MGTYASNFLLDEEKYVGIVQGWNDKLSSSSLRLSELTPFVELYAVFKSNDVIYSMGSNIASEIDQRLVNVKIKENKDDKEHLVKIAPICSTNKGQLEKDSLQAIDSSYRGQPGINDLTVARGAAASLNVKYDLSITIPNPEIFNELFEYSRLISTNSTFLIIYGWNIPNTFGSSQAANPPNLSSSNNRVPTIDLKTGGKGYYEAALVNVYKFDFSFDNVGHLTGKVSFLPEIGSFLVGTRTDTISKGVLNRLISHDGRTPDPDEEIKFTVGGVELTKPFSEAINPTVEVTRDVERVRPPLLRPTVEPEKKLKKLDTLADDGEYDRIVGTEPDNSLSIGDINDTKTKVAQAAYKAAVEAQGKFDLPNDGSPYRQGLISGGGAGVTTFTVDVLSSMPNYGSRLMTQINNDLFDGNNPNYDIDGLFPTNFNRPILSPPQAARPGKADVDTHRIRLNSSIISVPLISINPAGDENDESSLGISLNRSASDEVLGSVGTSKIFIQSQPVYFFLGAVLEAISKAISPASTENANDLDTPSVKFVYNDLPLESNETYSVPIPQPSKEQFEADKTALAQRVADAEKTIEELEKKIADRPDSYMDEEGNFLSDDKDDGEENADGEKVSPLDAAIAEDRKEIHDLTVQKAIDAASIESFDIITEGFVNSFKALEVVNVFDMPLDISRVRSIMSNGNAPLHSLIKQIIDIANDTNPTVKLATRPYNKNSRYIEVYAANIEVEGVSKDIFNSLRLQDFGQEGQSIEERVLAANQTLSQKTVVCEFGTERSLVENFSLNAKVDATAFASFRLPAVVGGRSIDLSELVRAELNMENSSLLGDIEGLLRKGFISSKKQLEDLKIISTDTDTGKVVDVNTLNLRSFLGLAASDGTKGPTTAGRQIVVRLIDELRAADSDFSNSIIAKQNARLMAGADANSGPNKPSFFGGVLSNFLRKITLTIHGTVGLSTFNLIYVKGLMRGIEGIYQITSVSESLTPANFTTTLECTLVNYKNDNPKTNPFAGDQIVSLTQLSESSAAGSSIPDYQTLLDQTATNLENDRNNSTINWGGSP